jgi:hypothetical protein
MVSALPTFSIICLRQIHHLFPIHFYFLPQKAFQNLFFRFFCGETQGHQLQDLLAGDLADGGFVDQACVHMVAGDFGNGADTGFAHDDGIAADVAEAGAVALYTGVENLETFGYYLYVKSSVGDLIDSDPTFPVLSAIGLCMTAVMLPSTILMRKGLRKFGPSVD